MRITPDRRHHERHEPLYNDFGELYPRTGDIMQRLPSLQRATEDRLQSWGAGLLAGGGGD